MKGIILAAGKGTRLYPITRPVCKPLLPIYDKPMIYYPLAILIQAGIRDIMIITPPGEDRTAFERLLEDGSQFGVHISYEVQHVARGIANALLIGADFIAGDRLCLVLGDNIIHGEHIQKDLMQAMEQEDGATIFGRYVDDPRAFGVVEFDGEGNVLSLEEKPSKPRSNYIVPGLYFYDSEAVQRARTLKPSARGELEITDLNRSYMQDGKLRITLMDRDSIWMDAGTADGLLDAARVVRDIQQKTNRYVACLEEISLNQGFITPEMCLASGESMSVSAYGKYLATLPGKTTEEDSK